jgi:hypothetical protein
MLEWLQNLKTIKKFFSFTLPLPKGLKKITYSVNIG